ncbi:hypothetical protein Mgra_00002956 [Meloidogyne graminicola]|uniref:Uncharacterized protein n=1 Tax=Meloidogyne graminicola TaxID=189291 RepID=A0A8S9ZVT1_9BILA|nr:hypothetical protein Mgra_00002956 [Meloidogyne graminicola]
MRRKSSSLFSFYFSPSILIILLFSISIQLQNNQINAYYSQQLFLPSGYLNKNLFGFQHPTKIGDSGHLNEESKMVIIEENNNENNELENKEIPRRQMRHLLADEFGSGQISRQFKRMRPCFYSPIQCLMRKRRSEK